MEFSLGLSFLAIGFVRHSTCICEEFSCSDLFLFPAYFATLFLPVTFSLSIT